MHAAEEESLIFSAFYLIREHALPNPTPCADEQEGLCFRHVRDPWPDVWLCKIIATLNMKKEHEYCSCESGTSLNPSHRSSGIPQAIEIRGASLKIR